MADGGRVTSKVRLRRVEVVINPLSGSVGPTALADMIALLETCDFKSNVVAAEHGGLMSALEDAVRRKPDLLIVLAGDGTARAACELCGERGPLVAPLPGGTMNILPKALYGNRDWKTALADTLATGVVRDVSGGEIDGHRFYVAAMIGWPTLWAKAREAAREGQLVRAIQRARVAYRSAFIGRVRFSLDGRREEKAEALTLLCPLISKTMTKETALEVAALNPTGLGEALRVGARALIGDWFGDWRDDPAVDMGLCRKGRVRGRYGLPALVDGEPVKLRAQAQIRFLPKAFRAFAPPPETPSPEIPV